VGALRIRVTNYLLRTQVFWVVVDLLNSRVTNSWHFKGMLSPSRSSWYLKMMVANFFKMSRISDTATQYNLNPQHQCCWNLNFANYFAPCSLFHTDKQTHAWSHMYLIYICLGMYTNIFNTDVHSQHSGVTEATQVEPRHLL